MRRSAPWPAFPAGAVRELRPLAWVWSARVFTEHQRWNETAPNKRQTARLAQRGERWEPSEWVLAARLVEHGDQWEPSKWVFPSKTASRTASRAQSRVGTDGLASYIAAWTATIIGTLSEWVEVPVGVVAQIQGHKPSAIAEKHYRRRPLDLLRMWHDKIEAWMLEQAKIRIEPQK